MRIIFPHKNRSTETDMNLVRLDTFMAFHWHLSLCGYPYEYFKRK